MSRIIVHPICRRHTQASSRPVPALERLCMTCETAHRAEVYSVPLPRVMVNNSSRQSHIREHMAGTRFLSLKSSQLLKCILVLTCGGSLAPFKSYYYE